jgi:hypothetical protein
MAKKRFFSIFKVHDYKGGELSSSVNLDYAQFISELIDSLYTDVVDDFYDDQISEEDLLQYIKDYEVSFKIYAGGDENGFCGEMYEHVNGTLIEVDIADFYEDIAKYLIEQKKDQ